MSAPLNPTANSAAFHLHAVGLAHAEVLAALHGACFDAGWDAASCAATLGMAGCYGFIAVRDGDKGGDGDGEPLGFALFRVAASCAKGGEAEILSIATRAHARGRGVARALLDKGLEVARARGAGDMFLEVAEDNLAAIGLYRGCGFRETGRRKDYYRRFEGARVDALTMALDLSG